MCDNKSEKPPIILPFEEKQFDLGIWADTHKVGLFVTIILYLIFAITLVSTRIVIVRSRPINAIAIDLQELEALERKRDELKKSVEELKKQTKEEWDEVQNQISNENSTEEAVGEAEEIDVEQLLSDAAEFQRNMEANRIAYESGLAEAEALRESYKNRPKKEKKRPTKHRDAKVKGNVTVTYSLYNPVRHSHKLNIPAYMCSGGGEVKIMITVDRTGDVISAKWLSGGDECMQQAAIQSAQTSSFNSDFRAAERQVGTITYIFIPQ